MMAAERDLPKVHDGICIHLLSPRHTPNQKSADDNVSDSVPLVQDKTSNCYENPKHKEQESKMLVLNCVSCVNISKEKSSGLD